MGLHMPGGKNEVKQGPGSIVWLLRDSGFILMSQPRWEVKMKERKQTLKSEG